MYPMTLEAFQNDPALRRRLFEAAHRERSRAIREGLVWLFGALAWLPVQLVARFKPVRPARWIARLG